LQTTGLPRGTPVETGQGLPRRRAVDDANLLLALDPDSAVAKSRCDVDGAGPAKALQRLLEPLVSKGAPMSQVSLLLQSPFERRQVQWTASELVADVGLEFVSPAARILLYRCGLAN